MDRNCQLTDRADLEPQHVPLPALSEELLQKTKAGGLVWSDSRRFPRFEANAVSVLRSEGTYAALGHVSRTQEVWLRDLSRGGARSCMAPSCFRENESRCRSLQVRCFAWRLFGAVVLPRQLLRRAVASPSMRNKGSPLCRSAIRLIKKLPLAALPQQACGSVRSSNRRLRRRRE